MKRTFGLQMRNATSLFFLLAVASAFFFLHPIYAQAPAEEGDEPNVSNVVTGLQELSQFERGTTFSIVIGRLIGFLTGIIGSLALIMFIYGGVMFMTSAGNAEKKKKAMLIMIWTSLGVVATLASYIIVRFVFGAFG